MRQVPDSIAAALNDFENNAAQFFADFYLEDGPEKVLASQADWAGVGDAAAGGVATIGADGLVEYTTIDTNLTVNDNAGVLQLAKGVAHGLFAGAVTGAAGSIQHQVTVRDNFSDHWLWGYKHLSTTRLVPINDPARYYYFTAQSNQIVDGIGFNTRATSSIGPLRTGTVRIIDVLTGNQIGREVAFTPTGASSAIHAVGLAAFIKNGNDYAVEFNMNRPTTGALSYAIAATLTYTYNLFIEEVTLDSASIWAIEQTPNSGFNLSGNEGFQAAGDGYRTLDIGQTPTGLSGYLSFKDVIPADTGLVIDLYYTDDATLAETAATVPIGVDPAISWVKLTAVTSGLDLSAYLHRYWRLHAQFTSNAPTNDQTPQLDDFKVAFRSVPVTYGTIATLTSKDLAAGLVQQESYDSLDSVSTVASEMSPSIPKSIMGAFRLGVASDEYTDDLTDINLRGKEVIVRMGFAGLEETMFIYGGIAEDLKYRGGLYEVDLIDNINLSDVSIPDEKYGDAWVATTAYVIGDKVVFGQVGYSALTNNTNITPVGNPSDWQDDGSVWANISYAGVHLADVITDLITNQINIPAERLDLASMDAVKNKYPNMTSTRIIADPVKGFEEISQAAWFLRSKFISSAGKLKLVNEPESDSTPADVITDEDIVDGSVVYSRGYKDLANACYIATGYNGKGDDIGDFTNGFVVVDADSSDTYKGVWLKDFRDKWGIFAPEFPIATVAWVITTAYVAEIAPGTPASLRLHNGESYRCILNHVAAAANEPNVGADWTTYWERNEVVARARDFVNRNKDGRRIFTFNGVMRLSRLEGGDVVDFQSKELPPNEQNIRHRTIVVSNNVNFEAGTAKLTLMEL